MKNPQILKSATLATATLLLFAACGGGGDDGPNPVAGSVVSDKYQAEDVVETLAQYGISEVIDLLPGSGQGVFNYSGEVVHGDGGTAKVDGQISYKKSASSSTVSSQLDIQLLVEFDNFKVAYTSGGKDFITVSGTVAYEKHETSRQSGLSYSSSKSVRVAGSDVDVALRYENANIKGVSDKITFNASGKTDSLMSGYVNSSSGNRFNF